MSIQQLSVFVENQKGKLVQITQVLADAAIDIRALSVADTADYGILRLIVSDTDRAVAALKEARCVVSVTEVLGIAVSDTPGSFAAAVRVLAENEINIEYVYAFITPEPGSAYVVMRVTDNDAATAVLQKAGVRVIGRDELDGLFA